MFQRLFQSHTRSNLPRIYHDMDTSFEVNLFERGYAKLSKMKAASMKTYLAIINQVNIKSKNCKSSFKNYLLLIYKLSVPIPLSL